MKKSIIYILLAITFILAVAAIVPWVFIGYGVYKVADTSEKVSDAIEKALDTPSEGLSKNNMTESDNSYSMKGGTGDRSVSYPFFSGYERDEAFPQNTDLSPVPPGGVASCAGL